MTDPKSAAFSSTDLAALEKLCEAATPYDGYTIDRQGNVWSTQNWRGYGKRKLTPFPNSDGYPAVKVKHEGRMKKALVHIVVCQAFHGPKPTPEYQVCHLNGDRSDCRADNLRWGTAADNAADREAHGKTARGSRNGFAVLTEDKAARIKAALGSQRQIAKLFGVSQRIVGKILRGESWVGGSNAQ